MKKMRFFRTLAASAVALLSVVSAGAMERNEKENFNDNWRFFLQYSTAENEADFSAENGVDVRRWKRVSLPHTAHVEPLLIINQWQGISWYRKEFNVAEFDAAKNYFVEFEGAMGIAEVWVNGQKAAKAEGGFLPLVADLTGKVKAGKNVIAVRLDNRDNPDYGPKPMKILDFCMYGGLYRNAWFYEKGDLYISNPSLANKVAGGGVFVTTPKVSTKESVVDVKSNIVNSSKSAQKFTVKQSIYFGDKLVASSSSKSIDVAPFANVDYTASMKVKGAALWSPEAPNLYNVKTEVVKGGKVVDEQVTRFGIREFKFVDNKLYINGKETFLRGVNRHQEYPFIGYALSDNAQYRDAKKIKDGGFDYVRLSHYPHSTAFMKACDELGIVLIDAILGWQYYNPTEAFQNNCYEQARKLVRRDRNHPSVIAWEVSLNETKMPIQFMQKLHDIVHEELPVNYVYSCGWMNEVYDIFLQARQHRLLHKDELNFDKPYSVSEYGDWEYYSTNAGLNQHSMLAKDVRIAYSSRQFRKDGEARMLQQAYNHQEAHNDNLKYPAFSDGYWVMFDYNRGYHPDIEASGVMDIFRLPKFTYSLYASQREMTGAEDCVLTIASYWDSFSDPNNIKVFSNAAKVALYLDDKLIARQKPDSDENTTHLAQAPFTFKMAGGFKAGTLKAVAYDKSGKEMKAISVSTPKLPVKLKLTFDESGRQAETGVNDVLFLYIAAVDENGTTNPYYKGDIELQLPDGLTLMNIDAVECEAGIATAVVVVDEKAKSGQTLEVGAKSVDGMHARVLEGEATLKLK